MNNCPLVTVAICSYNSCKYILEALESVYSQTYSDIELIISDDASSDDTLLIARGWAGQHNTRKRFRRIEILEVEKNTGVSANANRALEASQGQWILFLAGDDALKPNCITDNMDWIAAKPEIKVLFSRVEVYKGTFDPDNFLEITEDDSYDPKSIMAFGRSAESQYKLLLIADRIHYTPSAFLNRETLISLGGFDDRFRLLEDYPLWLNFTRNGYKLYFMNKVTVKYRQHPGAINNTGITYVVNPNYFRMEDFRKVYIYPNLPTDIRLSQRFFWYASQIFQLSWFNRDKKPNRLFMTFLTSYFNPIKYYIHFKKLLYSKLKDNEFYA